jgi:hypothetical protein
MAVAESRRPGNYQIISATIARHSRNWHVTWIAQLLPDFNVSGKGGLRVAVAYATALAADFYRDNPHVADFEFALYIFGRPVPVTEGAQLIVTGDPGELTATDTRDDSVLHGPTVDSLLALAGVDPAQPGDYGIGWIRTFPAILAVAEKELAALGTRKVRYYRQLAKRSRPARQRRAEEHPQPSRANQSGRLSEQAESRRRKRSG